MGNKQYFKINEAASIQWFDLRWVLHYSNGVIKRGMWNDSIEGDIGTSAALQKREGILFACVESQDTNAVIRTVAECSGQDFRMFQWMATQGFTATVGGSVGYANSPAKNHGIKLISTQSIVCVYFNGIISVEYAPMLFQDQLFHYGRV